MAKFILCGMTRALETDGAAGRKAKQVHLAPQSWTLTDAHGKWLYHRGKSSERQFARGCQIPKRRLKWNPQGVARDAPALF